MTQIPDPSWKLNPDIVANESADDRYAWDDDYAIFDEDQPDDFEADQPEETALIAITQLPEIQENLRALRERWEAKAAEAAGMVCNAETVQSIKNLRADMRKEFDAADSQRKAVKERYMAAWNDVEATWKECVANPFKAADAAYKTTIDAFETELKDRCRAELQTYFAEICMVHGVDFLTLDQALCIGKVKITLADAQAKTPRKLQDAISNAVAIVATDMDRIAATYQDDGIAAEVLDEYKRCLDVGKAAEIVAGRRRRVEAEREAQESRKREKAAQEAVTAKVNAVAPPVAVAEPPKPEKIFPRITFSILNVTRTQAVKVREFLKQEGIKYE